MSTPNSLLRIRHPISKLRIPSSSRRFPTKTSRYLSLVHYVYRDLPDGFWFKGSVLLQQSSGIGANPKRPPDERRVKIGKSMRSLFEFNFRSFLLVFAMLYLC